MAAAGPRQLLGPSDLAYSLRSSLRAFPGTEDSCTRIIQCEGAFLTRMDSGTQPDVARSWFWRAKIS
ncbi:unnamed protein product [Bubo scandiacus]